MLLLLPVASIVRAPRLLFALSHLQNPRRETYRTVPAVVSKLIFDDDGCEWGCGLATSADFPDSGRSDHCILLCMT